MDFLFLYAKTNNISNMKKAENALYQSPETRNLDLMVEQHVCAVSVPSVEGDTEGFDSIVDFEW